MIAKKLNDLLFDVITDAKNAGIPIDKNINKTVQIDTNRVDRMGYCDCKVFEYTIHITDIVLSANVKYIKDILGHEILHTCFLAKNHSWPWCEYAKIMNNKYGYNIKEKYNSWKEIGVIV